jgi:hypothetical protein
VKQDREVFVGLDVAKARHAVAIAEDGRGARSGSLERSERMQHPFVAWSAGLRSVTLGCTSAMKPVRLDMVCIGS